MPDDKKQFAWRDTIFCMDRAETIKYKLKQFSKVLCVASRGRGEDNAQHFEARTDGCTSTLTSVTKDNLILTICQKNTPNPTRLNDCHVHDRQSNFRT